MKREHAHIQSENAKLRGELYIPSAIPAPGLLICHGLNARGSHGLRLYTQLAKTACQNGFVTLVIDFRGVGESTGEFDYGMGEQKDVEYALDYLASRPEVMLNRIFVVGHSLGGAVSLYTLRKEKRVRGLVLWSTPKNHDYNVRKFIKRTKGRSGLFAFLIFSRIDKLLDVSRLFELEVYGVNLRPRYVREKLMKLNECEAASKLNLPMLIVVGANDTIVGVDEAEEIYRNAKGPKSLLVIDGADHIFKGKEQELITKTVEWIKKLHQTETANQNTANTDG